MSNKDWKYLNVDQRFVTLSDAEMSEVMYYVRKGEIGYDDAQRMQMIDETNPMVTKLMWELYEVIDGQIPPDSELF